MPRLSESEKKILSANLHKLLDKFHMSIPHAAQICSISLRTFESYYYAEKSPSIKNLTIIANAFLITPTALIAEEMSEKTIDERRTYFEMSKLLGASAQSDLSASLNRHFDVFPPSLLQLFKDLGLMITFLPTFTYEDFTSNLIDDYNFDAVKEYTDIYDKRFEISSDASEDIRKTVEKLKAALMPEREQYILEHAGLDYVIYHLDKGTYKNLDDVPVKVRISTLLDVSNAKRPADLIIHPQEYSLTDLCNFKDHIIDEIYDFLE